MQVSAKAQWMREPLRVQDPAYAPFFLEKMNSWFEQNIYSFSKNFQSEEKNLLQAYLKNQKSLGVQDENYFLRAFSYGLHFSPQVFGESAKVYTLEIFNTEKHKDIAEKMISLIEKKTPLKKKDLEKADILGWKWSSEKNQFSVLLFNKNPIPQIQEIQFVKGQRKDVFIQLGIKTKDHCVGLMASENLQRDERISGNEKSLICHSIRFEPEAWGPVAEKINSDFLKGLNLQPGMIERSESQASLYYP